MFHSLSVRLLVVMVTLPVIALLAVGFAIGRNNESELRDYITARREAGVSAGVRAEGQAVDPSADLQPSLFFLKSVPVTSEGEVEPQAFSVPLMEFEPELLRAQAIRIQPGSGALFDVYGDPAIVKALDAQRASTLGALNNFVILTTAIAGAAAVAAAFVISRGVTRPVEALTAAARRMESGDLSQRVDIHSRDEIGELAHAFNAMAERMEQNLTLRRRMASDVAHELRTPLNNVTGYLDAIADKIVEASPEVVSLLQQETQALVRLVQDVEQLSEADAGELPLSPETCDLRDIATAAVTASSARAADAGIDLCADLQDSPSSSHGDINRLGQVVRNLLDNALRHTPRGGAITVSVRTNEDGATITIDDTGPGIAPEHLAHIFDRFYRADPARTRATGGAGLGLAIVRQIVEAHGGTVTAENRDGGGAAFVVSLPRLAAP